MSFHAVTPAAVPAKGCMDLSLNIPDSSTEALCCRYSLHEEKGDAPVSADASPL